MELDRAPEPMSARAPRATGRIAAEAASAPRAPRRPEALRTGAERLGDAVPPEPAAEGAGARVALLSPSEVLQHGLLALLPPDWRQHAELVSNLAAFERALSASCRAAIIDAEALEAAEAVRAARAHGAAAVLVVGCSLCESPHEPDPWMLTLPDAIVARDELDRLSLRIALAVGALGMRLLPRSLPLGQPPPAAAPPLDEPGRQVLGLLAAGRRDAEIAAELHISESAVRKLVQRTVRRIGARTRCEAVAILARDIRRPR
jgi:DNA-binding NarL/FixJ family response regulator